jgi:PEP-CTERM motif-containing protein
MKRTLLTLAVAACAASVFAQGTVIFNNRINTVLVAPVFGLNTAGPGPDWIQLQGNGPDPSIWTPTGTTTYGNAVRLQGSGFTAQLWGAPGFNQPESALVLCGGYSTATFRTGAATSTVPGAITTSTALATVNGTLGTGNEPATLQMRAWDNQGGTITSWAQALFSGLTVTGRSATFNILLGGGVIGAPTMDGLSSFNLTTLPIDTPEPSTLALAGLGAACLLFCRRRGRGRNSRGRLHC